LELGLGKVVVKRITVIEFEVNGRGGSGTGYFGIKLRADTAELINMIVPGFGEIRSDMKR